MPMTLHDALRETLEGWQADLAPAWLPWLGDVELGFSAIDPALVLNPWEPIFPVRKGRVVPGMPAGAHLLRAFEGIAPEQVRCVLLGQDPYPAIEAATGRAFEIGNIAQWRELDKMFTKSIRAWVQTLAHARTGNAAYAGSFANWPATLQALETGTLMLEDFGTLAQRWVDSGVLLLNSALTLSRFAVAVDAHQARGHLPLWQPLLQRVIRCLCERGQPLVFLAFGDAAVEQLAKAGVHEGVAGPVMCIARAHPAQADEFLRAPNPLLSCNQHLERCGVQSVAW